VVKPAKPLPTTMASAGGAIFGIVIIILVVVVTMARIQLLLFVVVNIDEWYALACFENETLGRQNIKMRRPK
jgi:hypothetical protein